MFDWEWLLVVGEIGISYGLYRWWRKSDIFVAALEVAPDLNIDDLKTLSSLTNTVDFASVRGVVQKVNSNPSSILRSQFALDCIGVIHRLTIREHKLEKHRDVWTETHKVISDSIRFVPFRLATSNNNYVQINKPLDFHSIKDQLEVTHVKVDLEKGSTIRKFVEALFGNISKGIETKEQMLLLDAHLTGVGRLEKHSSTWYLVPHEKQGGILTRLNRSEILSTYRKQSKIALYSAIAFAIITSCTTIYILHKYYLKRKRRVPNRLSQQPQPQTTIPPTLEQNRNDVQTNHLTCVICLDNDIIYSLQPCSHLGLCHSCAQRLQSSSSQQELCPICRTPIQQYQRIFLP